MMIVMMGIIMVVHNDDSDDGDYHGGDALTLNMTMSVLVPMLFVSLLVSVFY